MSGTARLMSGEPAVVESTMRDAITPEWSVRIGAPLRNRGAGERAHSGPTTRAVPRPLERALRRAP